MHTGWAQGWKFIVLDVTRQGLSLIDETIVKNDELLLYGF